MVLEFTGGENVLGLSAQKDGGTSPDVKRFGPLIPGYRFVPERGKMLAQLGRMDETV
jgi:hypothetical protein